MSAIKDKGVLRMLRCTLCEAAASSKAGLAEDEVLAFYYAHEKTPGHAGTLEATWRASDGSLTRGLLDTSKF